MESSTHHITSPRGKRFTIKRMRLCDVLCVESKARVWVLWNGLMCDNNYVGNFQTKRAALAQIVELDL